MVPLSVLREKPMPVPTRAATAGVQTIAIHSASRPVGRSSRGAAQKPETVPWGRIYSPELKLCAAPLPPFTAQMPLQVVSIL